MANWGRRVNLSTWIALVFALVFWVIGLSGLAALSRVYQDPGNAEQVSIGSIFKFILALQRDKSTGS